MSENALDSRRQKDKDWGDKSGMGGGADWGSKSGGKSGAKTGEKHKPGKPGKPDSGRPKTKPGAWKPPPGGSGSGGLSDSQAALRMVKGLVHRQTAPSFLRLAFHDAFSGDHVGVDGSIVFETDHANNRALLPALESLQRAKADLLTTNSASLADVIAIAAAHAVASLGGPVAEISLGRSDASMEGGTHPPTTTHTLQEALAAFQTRGFDAESFVAMSGGHTIGRNRMDQTAKRVPLDSTPGTFDNQYFRDVEAGRGVFGFERAMSVDPTTAEYVRKFARDQDSFFEVWCTGFCKMVGGGCTCSPPPVRLPGKPGYPRPPMGGKKGPPLTGKGECVCPPKGGGGTKGATKGGAHKDYTKSREGDAQYKVGGSGSGSLCPCGKPSKGPKPGMGSPKGGYGSGARGPRPKPGGKQKNRRKVVTRMRIAGMDREDVSASTLAALEHAVGELCTPDTCAADENGTPLVTATVVNDEDEVPQGSVDSKEDDRRAGGVSIEVSTMALGDAEVAEELANAITQAAQDTSAQGLTAAWMAEIARSTGQPAPTITITIVYVQVQEEPRGGSEDSTVLVIACWSGGVLLLLVAGALMAFYLHCAKRRALVSPGLPVHSTKSTGWRRPGSQGETKKTRMVSVRPNSAPPQAVSVHLTPNPVSGYGISPIQGFTPQCPANPHDLKHNDRDLEAAFSDGYDSFHRDYRRHGQQGRPLTSQSMMPPTSNQQPTQPKPSKGVVGTRQVNRLPQVIIGSPHQEDTCCVCLEKMRMGDRVTQLPCKHKIHKKCIQQWAQKSASCPVCKAAI